MSPDCSVTGVTAVRIDGAILPAAGTIFLSTDGVLSVLNAGVLELGPVDDLENMPVGDRLVLIDDTGAEPESVPAALRRQLQDLAAFVSAPPPAVAVLAQAFADRRLLDGPPDGVSVADWQALVAALAPLLDALDRSVARTLRGESLFR